MMEPLRGPLRSSLGAVGDVSATELSGMCGFVLPVAGVLVCSPLKWCGVCTVNHEFFLRAGS